ncbi:MAG: aldo/keto reductase [Chloroflexi bacterium]|nr:aldo/keto reductase [Chloroflexota bacterium]
MNYRRFGKLDWKVSALGFGAMRLPTVGGDPSKVDEAEAIRMIRYAIDHGVNYIDSAYGYHSGQSERIVGKALQDGYRAKTRIATKLPARNCQSAADFDRIFNEQLEKLQVQKLDFYLMHGLNGESWRKVRDMGVLRWAEAQMAKGLFDHLGFSFHDSYDAFRGILGDYDNWTFCQIQYNYMDVEHQAGRRGVEYAAARGLGIVVMEPMRGGKLSKAPEPVARVWDSTEQKRGPVEWALQWVWNQPEISLALSGMSTMEQVTENVILASRSAPSLLTTEELAIVDRAREAYRGLTPVSCTNCRYCMPCPNGVNIPGVFEIYNEAVMYDDTRGGRFRYRGGPTALKIEERADQCIECGECLEACPQRIEIPDWLKKAHELLGPRQ